VDQEARTTNNFLTTAASLLWADPMCQGQASLPKMGPHLFSYAQMTGGRRHRQRTTPIHPSISTAHSRAGRHGVRVRRRCDCAAPSYRAPCVMLPSPPQRSISLSNLIGASGVHACCACVFGSGGFGCSDTVALPCDFLSLALPSPQQPAS
jgi:hypothetical protein